MTQGSTPPGWYDDGQGSQRWWDGHQWTEHTRPAGGGPQQPQPGSEPAAPYDPHSEPTQFGSPPSGTDVGQQGWQQPAGGGYPPQPGHPQQGWPSSSPAGHGGGGGGKGKLIAVIGGGVAVVAVAVVLLVVLLGGSGGPSGTVEDVFDAAKDGDPCAVIEHLSNSALGTDEDGRDDAVDTAVDECEASSPDSEGGAGCELEIVDEEVDGDKATVTAKITGCDDESDNEEEDEIDLVKEGGDWRLPTF